MGGGNVKECIACCPKWQEKIWNIIRKLIPLQGEVEKETNKKTPKGMPCLCKFDGNSHWENLVIGLALRI